ncbi:MAG TPA: hypothetical protein VKG79_06875 [Bryobacteraceae bacterium]|nr:hypothetical protein [Bryobacteraceae bacterium]
MSGLLEAWLKRATRHLSEGSRAQVRTEIEAHYESACEEALGGGASAGEADRAAVASLGDPGAANRAYRKVLLTDMEAALLRETRCGVWSGSKRWLWLLPTLVLIAGIRFLATGDAYFGWTLLTGASGLALLASAFRLPVYTPVRGRIFRAFRLLWLAAILALTMRGSWFMLISCAWPLLWVEWTLFSLRRKLPVAEWPKQLYL